MVNKTKKNESLKKQFYCALQFTTIAPKALTKERKLPSSFRSKQTNTADKISPANKSDLFDFLKEERKNITHSDSLFDFLYFDEKPTSAEQPPDRHVDELQSRSPSCSPPSELTQTTKDLLSMSNDDKLLMEAVTTETNSVKRRLIVVEPDEEPAKRQRTTQESPTPNRTQPRGRAIKHGEVEIEKRIDKALSERMVLVHEDHSKTSLFERSYSIKSGQTGNTYQVTIQQHPSCTCPDNLSGRSNCFCKHILFVLLKVLKVDRNDSCLYQRDLLSSELYFIFQERDNQNIDQESHQEMDIYEFAKSARSQIQSSSMQQACPLDTTPSFPIIPLPPSPKKNSLPLDAKLLHGIAKSFEEGSPYGSQSTPTKLKKPIALPRSISAQESKNEDEDEKQPVFLDNRNGSIPGLLSDFKPGVYTPKKPAELLVQSPHQWSPQEFLCRDCKKAFCRKGDRDNHEKTLGHERWRRSAGRKLDFQ